MSATVAPAASTPSILSLAVRGRRPVMSADTLAWALYSDLDHVMALIGNRRIVGINVARPGVSRATVIVWTASVVQHLANKPPLRVSDDALIDDILPVAQPAIKVAWLARHLGVSADHIKNLIADGQITLATKGKSNLGPFSSPSVLRSSVAAFLIQGRLS